MKGRRRGGELVEEDENDGSLMAAIDDEDSVEPMEIEQPVDCNARAMAVVLSV